MEATIRTGSDIITLVNVFTVEPDNQQKLIQLLKEGTEAFFSKQPGFISSSVHAGKEGGRAINYSQWRSAGDIDNFRKDPKFAPYVQRLAAIARPRRSCARSSRSIMPELRRVAPRPRSTYHACRRRGDPAWQTM